MILSSFSETEGLTLGGAVPGAIDDGGIVEGIEETGCCIGGILLGLDTDVGIELGFIGCPTPPGILGFIMLGLL